MKKMVLIGFMLIGGVAHGAQNNCQCYIQSAHTNVQCKTSNDCKDKCDAYAYKCSSIKQQPFGYPHSTLDGTGDKSITSTDGWCHQGGYCKCPWGQYIENCGVNNMGHMTEGYGKLPVYQDIRIKKSSV